MVAVTNKLLLIICFMLAITQGIIAQGFIKHYDYPFAENAFTITQLSNGNFVMAGMQGISIGNSKQFLLCTDKDGNEIWHLTDTACLGTIWDILSLPDSSFLYTGDFNGNIGLAKRRYDGSLVWRREYPDSVYTQGSAIAITQQGDIVVTGSKHLTFSNLDILIMKVDTAGNIIWTNTFGGDETDAGLDILETYDNSYIVVGQTLSYIDSLASNKAFILKLGYNGDSLWFYTYVMPGNTGSILQTACELTNREILAGGWYYPNVADYGGYLLRVDSLGSTISEFAEVIGRSDFFVEIKYDAVDDKIAYSRAFFSTDSFSGIEWGWIDNISFQPHNLHSFNTEYEEEPRGLALCTDGGLAITASYEEQCQGCFQLIKTDSLGCVPLLCATDVSANYLNSVLSIYPNPVNTNYFFVETSGAFVPIDIRLHNISGQQVETTYHISGESKIKVELQNNVPSGLYVFSLVNSNGNIAYGKVMIVGQQ